MSTSSCHAATRQATRTPPDAHKLDSSEFACAPAIHLAKKTKGLWSDKMAFRVWLLCGLLLWLLGLINLVTGVARR